MIGFCLWDYANAQSAFSGSFQPLPLHRISGLAGFPDSAVVGRPPDSPVFRSHVGVLIFASNATQCVSAIVV